MSVVSPYYFGLADKLGSEWGFIFEDKVPVLLFSNGHSSWGGYVQVILLVTKCFSLSQSVGKLDDISYNSNKNVTNLDRMYLKF